MIARVAVPVPLRKTFDFRLPKTDNTVVPGVRVRVPFGRRKLIGVVVSLEQKSSVPEERLKGVLEVLDDEPIFANNLWQVLQWLSKYYLAPIGDVLDTAMPVLLRQGKPIRPASQVRWRLSDHGRSASSSELQRAPLQLALIERFTKAEFLSSSDFKSDNSSWRQAIRGLLKKGWLEEFSTPPELTADLASAPEVTLNLAQKVAADALIKRIEERVFSCSLLHGVTGSGKTEVYFAAMREVLDSGKQILFLVPEIGLTPQLVDRIKVSFDCGVTVLHSGLSDHARHTAWWHAREGHAGIVLGTRSAVFTPLKNAGLIVVDEEHDGSLKQQDGVRYQARDVAVYRAKLEGIPIVLGSATPSFETLHNAQLGRYHRLTLTDRASNATLPQIKLLDLRTLATHDGLSAPLIAAIKKTLFAGQQVMLFLNRRGYAPVLFCKSCGQTSQCHRCDSHLTFHRRSNILRCHHCGFECKSTGQCGHCQKHELAEVGEGTQRVEDALAQLFPEAVILRIDRDSTSRKGELESKLLAVANHQVDIVLGTQLLAKGHDFPAVTMVGVLGADQGLYSTDFRAREALFQQLLQVSGRAGRRSTTGRVYIQTAFPGEPFFEFVRHHDFDGFAKDQLEERRSAGFPPYGYFAVLRAESTHQSRALQFLRQVRYALPSTDHVNILDAVPAPMERRAGRYRAQLLINAVKRADLHRILEHCLHLIDQRTEIKQGAATVRWSLDIDPFDLY